MKDKAPNPAACHPHPDHKNIHIRYNESARATLRYNERKCTHLVYILWFHPPRMLRLIAVCDPVAARVGGMHLPRFGRTL